MGRGDKKTAKGKRTIGSYGVTRPKKASKFSAATTVEPKEEKVEVKKAAAKKPAAKKPVAKKVTAKKSESAE